MGTNFYARRLISPAKDTCPTCGHSEPAKHEERHIGKSSVGWNFMLHVYPEEGIHDLKDWEPILRDPDVVILNEYGDNLHPDLMLHVIQDRPEGLYRTPVDHFCLGPGEGTWDRLIGEFS